MKHLATALLIAAATIAPATLASAASVAPIPVPPGSQSCDSIAAWFGVQQGRGRRSGSRSRPRRAWPPAPTQGPPTATRSR